MAAFAVGTTVGALQVLFNIHVNMIDAAIVVLLYTLAAYCRRRVSVAGLAICLAGSAAAVARWAPAVPRPVPLDRAWAWWCSPARR